MQALPLGMSRLSKLVLLLLVLLTAAVPAATAHACAEQNCDTTELAVQASPDDADPGCSDCGPACANGCCHASHAATPVDLSVTAFLAVFDAPGSWSHSTAPPLTDASGPRRPPRA